MSTTELVGSIRFAEPAPEVDLAAARAAAEAMLIALGLPVSSPDMAETPRRLVDVYAELLAVPDFDLTTFDNGSGYDELVLVPDIPVRTVEFFARRVQTQERLTTQVADHLHDRLAPLGVGVVIEAEHSCMSLRGARATGATTLTTVVRGRLRDDPASRAEFLSLTRDRSSR